ncbi:MAG: site-specific integrase [Candidatus Caldatribacteriaceae bacterium]
MKPELEEALESFLQFLFWEKRVSDNTIAAYQQDITCFLEFLEQEGRASFQEVTLEILEKFVVKESKKGLVDTRKRVVF